MTVRPAYRVVGSLFAADVALQLAFAALGVFRAHPSGKAPHEQSAFAPHVVNGYIVMVLALLVLVVAVRSGGADWRFLLVLLVLTIVQNPLAHAGTVGGVLHGLNAFLIAGSAGVIAHRAWGVRPE